MTRIASIVSVLLHPLLMPFYAVLVMLLATPLGGLLPGKASFIILGTVFVLTCFMPFLFVAFLRIKGVVSSMKIRNRKERTLPLLFGAFMYYICYQLMAKVASLPHLFSKMFFALTVFLLILIIITRFWKISLHMAAVGGMLAIVFVFSFYSWLPLFVIFLAGLLGTSRLWLQAHNSMQVYAGFCLGVSFFIGYFL
ncbi:hypothetical protein C7377_0268 [Balneicella halophila]|uniref:PAP2 superfamily protein n=1 Tax=Balneicella halophila TaxID=1537566 RepID=A0A7L4USK6_BALHA|nr:hypothetical protein [Balneicella halophila]PVX51974.1 hypothetical protein C7377_0268 [Balneicella halophila]